MQWKKIQNVQPKSCEVSYKFNLIVINEKLLQYFVFQIFTYFFLYILPAVSEWRHSEPENSSISYPA